MVVSQRIQDTKDLGACSLYHEALLQARWEGQTVWNERQAHKQDEICTRLLVLERRMVWLCGFGTGVGALVGVFIGGCFR